jgi:hypothetical protein
MKKVLLGIGLVAFLASCSYRVVDFTIISTKNVDLSKAGTFKRGKTRVEGKDVAHMIIYFPIGRPSMKEIIIFSKPSIIFLRLGTTNGLKLESRSLGT